LFDAARWLREFDDLELKPEVRAKVLYQNACALLGLDPANFGETSATGASGEAGHGVD
jgi:hypothetical protein